MERCVVRGAVGYKNYQELQAAIALWVTYRLLSDPRRWRDYAMIAVCRGGAVSGSYA
jgi:hypothetical protein